MNFYAFHLGDYASATRHLSWDEDLAYRRLLDAYYLREGPLPVDQRQVYRLVMANTEEQRAAVTVVLDEFFTLTDSGYEHARCEQEIEAAQEKRDKAAQSALKRWRNANAADVALPSDCQRNANASPDVCERIETPCDSNAPNPNPNPNPSKPLSNPNGLLVAGKPAPPDCPQQDIVGLYHELLPACPRVREWTPTRQRLLRTRWAENAKRQTLDWWRRYFGYVAQSEFLTGRGSCAPGRDPFVADLEWLVKPSNFVKVIEGKYHREAA